MAKSAVVVVVECRWGIISKLGGGGSACGLGGRTGSFKCAGAYKCAGICSMEFWVDVVRSKGGSGADFLCGREERPIEPMGGI